MVKTIAQLFIESISGKFLDSDGFEVEIKDVYNKKEGGDEIICYTFCKQGTEKTMYLRHPLLKLTKSEQTQPSCTNQQNGNMFKGWKY